MTSTNTNTNERIFLYFCSLGLSIVGMYVTFTNTNTNERILFIFGLRFIHRWYVCDCYKYKYKRNDFFIFGLRVIHRRYVCDFYKYKYKRKDFLYFCSLGLSIGGMYVTSTNTNTTERSFCIFGF